MGIGSGKRGQGPGSKAAGVGSAAAGATTQDQGREKSDKLGSHPRTLDGRLNPGYEFLGPGVGPSGTLAGGPSTVGSSTKVYKPAHYYNPHGEFIDD